MHEYDVTLKLLLKGVTALATRALTGAAITKWLNVEIPEMRNTRVDLLGETEGGGLIHIELQSGNDPLMALRMLEYAARVYRVHRQFARQILLYVGESPLRMDSALRSERLAFSYQQVDVRELDGEPLLASEHISDNVIAILTRVRDQRDAVQRILKRVAILNPAERDEAFEQLFVLAGLRRLGHVVEEEAKKMPILNDIMDHDVLGPAIRKGELIMLQRQLTERFGPIPKWAADHLVRLSAPELEELGIRIFRATSIEDLLR